MADTKISDLAAAASLADTDLFVIAQEDTANKKVSFSTLREEVLSLLPLELDYVENTSAVALASTSEASPTTVITSSDLSVDGSTVVMVEFYCRVLTTPDTAGGFSILNLHVSTNSGSSWTDIGRILAAQRHTAAEGFGVIGFGFLVGRRLTPANGTVMYRVVGWVSSTNGSPAVGSGAGGAGTGMPIFLRVTKVVAA